MKKGILNWIVIGVCLFLLFFPILAFYIPATGRGGVTNLGQYLLGGGLGGGVGMMIIVLGGSLLFSLVANKIHITKLHKKRKKIISLLFVIALIGFPFLGGKMFVAVHMISYLFVAVLFLIMYLNLVLVNMKSSEA